jgi:hypothetical protein
MPMLHARETGCECIEHAEFLVPLREKLAHGRLTRGAPGCAGGVLRYDPSRGD